ncbi:hypothetical protein COBT_003453, partial [Conglomerata obtusa]
KQKNLKSDTKDAKGRFLDMGDIIGKCSNNSYLVKNSEGKMQKKSEKDLKSILFLKDETP